MKRISTLFTSTVLCLSMAVQAAERELAFGILSTESSQNLKHDWQPILEDMSRQTGLKVNAFFAPDYAGVIEAMRFNKVQVAWLGNKPGIEAVDRANGEVFAQVVASGGNMGYWSLLIVRKQSDIRSLDDFKKHSKRLAFGLGDPNSTSGFLVPSYYLLTQNGLDAKTSFKSVRNANHEVNFLAVINKQVDAAVVSSEILERFKDRDSAKVDEIRVVWRSPLIASDPLIWRSDLSADAKEKVRQFFVNYGKTPRERELLNKLVAEGFRPSNNAQLVPFRQLELFRGRKKIEDDATLSANEKKQKFDEIDRKLAALNQQLAEAK